MFRTSIATSLLLVVWLLVGCTGASTAEPAVDELTVGVDTELQGTIEVVGSTTVQPLVTELVAEFNQLYPNIQINVAGGGSGVGIEAVQDGRTDIGMSSRELREGELQDGMSRYQIATDVLAVIVHPSNPVAGLTSEQLKGIFVGEITNWSEVGGPDLAIMPVIREETSGTRGAFDELALDEEAPTDDANVQITASEVEATVASNENAIGYVGFGHIELDEIKVLQIDGVAPTREQMLVEGYRLQRPLLLLTGPLSRELADTFIEYVLSDEGQRLVEEDGWVPATTS